MEATHSVVSSSERFCADPLFRRSRDPMLLLDESRLCVDANAAAGVFFGIPIEAICTVTIDDLLAPVLRGGVSAMGSIALHDGAAMEGLPYDMTMRDGRRIAIHLSATPQTGPGCDLAILQFPDAHARDAGSAGAAPAASNLLTKREREVLTLVALGNTGLEIARQLFVSPATVQTHVVNALIKLGAKNRAHGIAIALQSAELDVDDALAHPAPAGADRLRREA